MKRVFKYFEPVWTGADGKISLRACLAIFLSWKLVENVDFAIQKWEDGRSLGDVSSIFFTLAGLIAALLGITAWSNMTSKKIDTEAAPPANTTITMEKAETTTSAVGASTEATNTKQTDTTTKISSEAAIKNEQPIGE